MPLLFGLAETSITVLPDLGRDEIAQLLNQSFKSSSRRTYWLAARLLVRFLHYWQDVVAIPMASGVASNSLGGWPAPWDYLRQLLASRIQKGTGRRRPLLRRWRGGL